jgi:hypothetical protein
MITKAVLPADSTQGVSGANWISTESGQVEFSQAVMAASVIGQLPCTRIPFRTRMFLDLFPHLAREVEPRSV